MTDIQEIIQILTNAGFKIIGSDTAQSYLVIEEPNCIVYSLKTFMEYAWIIICIITGMLIFGWAISKIRGAKTDIAKNILTLTVIFGTIGATVPIVNMIYGDDIEKSVCKTIKVPIAEVQKFLDLRKSKMTPGNDLYEKITIFVDDPIDDDDLQELESLIPVEIPLDDAPIQPAETQKTPISAPLSYSEEYTPPVPVYDKTHDADEVLRRLRNHGTGRVAPQKQKQLPPAPLTPPSQEEQPAPETPYVPHWGFYDNLPVRAEAADSKNVIYTYANNSKKRHNDGSRAWRNTNPGNIRPMSGQIGRAGGFGIYSSEEAGIQAIISLLRSPNYRDLTISQAIHKYAPGADGNAPVRYARTLSQRTGIPQDRTIKTLSDAQIRLLALEIQKVEGWKPGRIISQ